ncbi:dienelactone hydrolase family protein [Chelativorans salis]|uniref:Dienelactone hydrolase family protein n=1 Tax=Chelativorans salis TaxID=2978478 RepID=A0ABT2LQ74_9HYPH|nr:dienelactone hydrolase family protein [Chelativorans sp. EGI FJ00035]MCT7376700.1 dienelactone hydrolase family protein [Chelativorans sp. EGI FJ00035]
MMTQLTASDGHQLDCWMVPAQGTRRGGVVILQEIFGVTDQLKSVAARYAKLGYDVAIPALFDRRERGAVIPFDQGPRGRDLMLAATLEETMRDVEAAVQALAAKGGKVGVIGFCWGGGLALRAAQKLNVAAAVAFYGTRLPQYLDSPLRAPLLGHFGTKDDHVPPEMLDQAKAYLPDMIVHTYEAGHAFANDARPSYVADAAELAHERTAGFLDKHLA